MRIDATPYIMRTCRNLVKAEIDDIIRKKFQCRFPLIPVPVRVHIENLNLYYILCRYFADYMREFPQDLNAYDVLKMELF